MLFSVLGRGGNSTPAIYQYFPLFVSSELHPSATHQYDLMDFKWVFIICEAVSLDIEQRLHFCISYVFLSEIDMLNIFVKPRDSGVN